MKIVIIGGGIAGMALANLLLRKGLEVSLHERESGNLARGHAFLMHPAGIAILEELGNCKSEVPIPGQRINDVIISRPDLSEERKTELGNWLCLSRSETVQYLNYLLPAGIVKFGHSFSHFIYEDGKATTVVFENGESEKGDLFIASDGARSAVRQYLFGQTEFSAVEVKEIVGVVKLPRLIENAPNTFRKFVSHDKGLALGYVPCSHDKLVWFMQFDVRFQANPEESPQTLEALCRELLHDFPEVVAGILDANDFSNVYVWNSTDFELLPEFHKSNVILIGDAAHVALPFTSAGTTNALQDAHTLAGLIHIGMDVENAAKKFYSVRAPLVGEHIEFGRFIKNEFLNPSEDSNGPSIPLIQNLKKV
jgi:2-polyprenyl-6-methoxyphenol hydroxylase-like FAD-dependent oxidoreductase